MAMRIGGIHKLSPSSAGAMFCSPHRRRRPPLLSINTDKRQLCHIWLSSTAKQVERHHFLLLAIRCAKITFFSKNFDFFNFSILNLMAGYPSISAYSFDIGTSIVAHHSLSDAPKHVFTSHFLHRCRYVACHPSMDSPVHGWKELPSHPPYISSRFSTSDGIFHPWMAGISMDGDAIQR